MSIGLDRSRSSRRGGRARAAQPTVREVCLLGISHRARDEAWATGRRVTWLGRGYQVVAASPTPAELLEGRPAAAAPRRYIHLAPSDGSPETAS
jgi:hypothetical protein